ncbi:O-antigen polymerase/toluene tolerance protein [Alcanivorax nanhaiticus]|uniref:O-antigen polymerase/toluene tolerance protein n=1 Tax=Alcanivorax nanhaiticus TaxID=1177154 RepID=A0A095UPD8_9GAMM|nr:O-antigen ligase family protein [Alcanivorax nanhaiticus]KGD64395.1 O-antigen polymerase/toluene tolerance protein [Alcanivorax nanhaiticus]
MSSFLKRSACAENVLFASLFILFCLIGLERGGGKISSVFEPLLGIFAIFLLVRGRASSVRVDPFLLIAFLAYGIYYMVRWSAWSGPIDASVDMFRPVMQAFLFVPLIAWGVASAKLKSGSLLVFVLAGAAVACASILTFYFVQGHEFSMRIRPLGEARHPIIGMYYYAFPLLLGCVLLLEKGQVMRGRAILLVCIVVLMAVFLLSRSRGPFMGLLVTAMAAAFLASHGWRRWAIPVVVFGAAIAFLLAQDEAWLARLDTGRFLIWESVLVRLPEALWFGHGLTDENYVYFSDVYGWQHAHNIWLGHFYWGGAVGVFLLAAVYMRAAWVFYRANSWPVSAVGLLLICFGLAAMLTDGNLLLDYPGPEWMVFVLPVGLALGLSVSQEVSGKAWPHSVDV